LRRGSRRLAYNSGMSLRTRLSKPLLLSDGRCLRTIGDAIEVVLEMPEQALAAPAWTRVPDPLKTACFSGRDDDVARATAQLEAALSASPFGDARLLEQDKKPPAPSIRRQPKPARSVRRQPKVAPAPTRTRAKRG
jgi:hypothetical protein